MASKFRNSCEYHGARVSLMLLRILPPHATLAYAKFVADIAYVLLAKRRRTAITNILKAGITADRNEARHLARASFRSMALTTAESFIAPKLLNDPVKSREIAVLDIPPETNDLLHTSKNGAIFVSGHIGNWEIGAQAVTHYKPLAAITRRMNNERVQKLIDEFKFRDDFQTIDKHTSHPMEPVRALKNNRGLAILTDQHAHGDNAVIIDFFGHKAATYPTPAVLQRLTGAPIFFTYAIREGFLKFRIKFSKPIFYNFTRENREAETLRATQELAKMLEDVIRKYPEQYLWAHRRWKLEEKS